MFTRKLGCSGIEISALGLGCWAIGGPAWRGEHPNGWGQVDDEESIRAIHRALDLGINFFDTADVYGAGHSEEVLGTALALARDQVIIATKFGNLFDEKTKQVAGRAARPEDIACACQASLRRLQTDYIDLYQFHLGDYALEQAGEVRDALEQLVTEGRIRAYGWSTNDPERARFFAQGPHCVAIQQQLNVLDGNLETVAVCEEFDLASINRGPLAQGLLTGKYNCDSKFAGDDVRHGWNLREGKLAEFLVKLSHIREILVADGRTLAQGALGWLWALSEKTVPIPGFKTVKQVEENAGALDYGPLSQVQMAEIAKLVQGCGG